jgi:hypothetical protein
MTLIPIVSLLVSVWFIAAAALAQEPVLPNCGVKCVPRRALIFFGYSSHHFSAHETTVDIFMGQTLWKWEHLAIFNCPAPSSDSNEESYFDTSTADLELCVGDIVA